MTKPPLRDHKFLFWGDIQTMIDQISYKIKREDYDAIIGLTRGGLIPAVMLSHKLDLPLIAVDPKTIEYKRDFWDINYDKRYLIVDEINDSGQTLINVKHYFPKSSVYCLIEKKSSAFICNYSSRKVEADVGFITFPWEEFIRFE